MKILPQLEPYPSILSFIRRPETLSGSVPNKSLKMQNLTKNAKFSVVCLFYTYFWIPSWSNRFKTYFIWIFGSYLGGMDHFLVLCPFSWFYVTLFVLDLFVLIFEHFTVSNFGILLQPFCSNSNYNFWLLRLFFDVEHYTNSDISKPKFYDLFWEKNTLKLTKNKQKK